MLGLLERRRTAPTIVPGCALPEKPRLRTSENSRYAKLVVQTAIEVSHVTNTGATLS